MQQTRKIFILKKKKQCTYYVFSMHIKSDNKLEEKKKVGDQETQSEEWSKTGQDFHVGKNYLPLE